MSHSRRLKISSLVLSLLLLFSLFAVRVAGAATLPVLTVAYIDVGQGDSIWLHDSNGFDVLIDGGDTDKGPVVLAYLRAHHIDDIEVMLATHPDSDHIGGLIDVLNASDIPVDQVLYNGYPVDKTVWDDFTAAVAAKGLSLTVAQVPAEFTWGSSTASILNPVAGLTDPATNDASVVVRLSHGDVTFLFTGDISSTVESQILARGSSVSAQVLKVAHHGSSTSSSSAFLSAVGPQQAVISVGENSYGHPAADTLVRLASVGARVWRTDLLGTILVVSDGAGYTIRPETGSISYLPLVLQAYTPTFTTGNVVISNIFFHGILSQEPDEYVEIRNDDVHSIQLQGWTLRDAANHTYTFPSFEIQPAQVCRVYTDQVHPESCGFDYGSGSSIWNNDHDCAYLRDGLSQPVDDFCY